MLIDCRQWKSIMRIEDFCENDVQTAVSTNNELWKDVAGH